LARHPGLAFAFIARLIDGIFDSHIVVDPPGRLPFFGNDGHRSSVRNSYRPPPGGIDDSIVPMGAKSGTFVHRASA
jgi:hypothetical protein